MINTPVLYCKFPLLAPTERLAIFAEDFHILSGKIQYNSLEWTITGFSTAFQTNISQSIWYFLISQLKTKHH
jgi:hypothetical protein